MKGVLTMQDNSLVTMIQLRESNLHVGSYIIPLYGRKKMLHLVQVMIEGGGGLSRPELRSAIYRCNSDEEQSFRLRDSQDCSLSKLISRSRRHLKLALGGTPWGQTIDWFVYSERGKYWRLHQLRPSALSIHNFSAHSSDSNLEPMKVSEEVHGQKELSHVKILH